MTDKKTVTPQEAREALDAFNERLRMTGLTPSDEQERIVKAFHASQETIRRLLEAHAEGVGVERAGAE